MARAVLITGGNVGDVAQTMLRCNRMISERVGEIVKISSMAESEPWGFSAEQMFLNQALVVNTELSPIQLLEQTQGIERELGRVNKSRNTDQKSHYASRTIDIDILFYDDQIIDMPNLTIPHPLIQERTFVLTPLCEIERDLIHPILGKSMTELNNRLKDQIL